jgi:hypothetical protein
MALLMVALEKVWTFREVGGSNLEIGLDEKSGDSEDPSQPLFKMEVKVDIKPYQGEIDVVKLNHWLQ